MKKFLLTILGIAIYILLGWLIKDIVSANYSNPMDMLVLDMIKHEALIYCILAVGYVFVIQCFVYQNSDGNEASMWLPIGLCVASYFLLTTLSLSSGLIIAYNLLTTIALAVHKLALTHRLIFTNGVTVNSQTTSYLRFV